MEPLWFDPFWCELEYHFFTQSIYQYSVRILLRNKRMARAQSFELRDKMTPTMTVVP